MKKQFKLEVEEKRSLNRVRVGPSNEFNAKIGFKNLELACAVEDFHFDGIKLLLPSMSEDIPNLVEVNFLQLNYGVRPITRIERPKVIRFQKGQSLTLAFENSIDSRGIRGKDRLQIKPSFKPILMASDPIKISSLVTFTLTNFTSHGMSLETSLSNKHLVAGVDLKQTTLILPGVGILELSIKIMFVKKREKSLQVGVSLVEPTEEDAQALARFAIFGTLPATDGRIDSKFRQVKASVGQLKKLGSALRIETVSTARDYYSVLQIRHEAYKAAKKITENSTVEDMADKYDDHSIIIVGKIDGAVVATFRMVESKSSDEKFPFEEYIPFSVLDEQENRTKYFEVSRLAIDPKFQGTDILIRLFRENGRQTAINRKTNVCLSTRDLRKNYFQLGFKLVSKEIAHPVLKDEYLALMRIDPIRFLAGKGMSVRAWDLVVKDVVENMAFAGILPKPSKRVSRYFLRKIENLILDMSKRIKAAKKR